MSEELENAGAVWNDEIVLMARQFHDIYEEEAARLGWPSQTPVPFDELPEANKQTMLCTVARIRSRISKGVYRELIDQINELESASLRARPQEPGDLISREKAIKALKLLQQPVPPHGFEPGSIGAIASDVMDVTWEEAVTASIAMLNTVAPSGPQEPGLSKKKLQQIFSECRFQFHIDRPAAMMACGTHYEELVIDAILATTPATEQMKNHSLGGRSE